MPPPGAAERDRLTGVRGAATIPVVVAALTLTCLLTVVPDRGVGRFLAEGGWAGQAVLGTFALGLVGLGALAARRAWGASAPVAIELGLCVLPWVVGVVGMRIEAIGVFAPMSSPFEPRVMITKGIAEAMIARTLGAAATLSLALGVAAGLAALVRGHGSKGAPLDVLLVTTLAATSAIVVWSSRGLEVSLERSIEGDRATAMADAARYLVRGGVWALGAVCAGAVAQMLCRRRALSGAVAGLVVIATALAADRLAIAFTGASLADRRPEQWRAMAGFEPTAIPGEARGSDGFDVLVLPSTIVTGTGHETPWSGSALVDVLRRETANAGRNDPRAAIHDLPSVRIAFDRRIDGPRMKEIVAAARDAGVSTLTMVGLAGTRAEVDRSERSLENAPPFLRSLSDRFGQRRFVLERALVPGRAPPGHIVYVQVSDETTPDRLAVVTRRLSEPPRTRDDPMHILVLVTEPHPGAVVAR